jgi:hypothetical protein
VAIYRCEELRILDDELFFAVQAHLATTAAESVQRLRNWASGRRLNADAPGGIYTANPNSDVTVKPGQKVRREASNN